MGLKTSGTRPGPPPILNWSIGDRGLFERGLRRHCLDREPLWPVSSAPAELAAKPTNRAKPSGPRHRLGLTRARYEGSGMHGRSVIAALVVAAPVLLFGAFVSPPAVAKVTLRRKRPTIRMRAAPTLPISRRPHLTPPCRRPPIRRRRPRLRPANPHQLPVSPASHKFRPSTFRRRVRRWLKPSGPRPPIPRSARRLPPATSRRWRPSTIRAARRSG